MHHSTKSLQYHPAALECTASYTGTLTTAQLHNLKASLPSLQKGNHQQNTRSTWGTNEALVRWLQIFKRKFARPVQRMRDPEYPHSSTTTHTYLLPIREEDSQGSSKRDPTARVSLRFLRFSIRSDLRKSQNEMRLLALNWSSLLVVPLLILYGCHPSDCVVCVSSRLVSLPSCFLSLACCRRGLYLFCWFWQQTEKQNESTTERDRETEKEKYSLAVHHVTDIFLPLPDVKPPRDTVHRPRGTSHERCRVRIQLPL